MALFSLARIAHGTLPNRIKRPSMKGAVISRLGHWMSKCVQENYVSSPFIDVNISNSECIEYCNERLVVVSIVESEMTVASWSSTCGFCAVVST
jgi:hypothetical protein